MKRKTPDLGTDEVISILSRLDDEGLANICLVNKKYYSACMNNKFVPHLKARLGDNSIFLDGDVLHENMKKFDVKNPLMLYLRLNALLNLMNHLKLSCTLEELRNASKLDLNNKNLDVLPHEIGQLHDLKKLCLCNN